jgi:hypothetical protein
LAKGPRFPYRSSAFTSIDVRASKLAGVNGRDGSFNEARASANTSAMRPRPRVLPRTSSDSIITVCDFLAGGMV